MEGKTLKEIVGAEERSVYMLILVIAHLSTLVRDMLPRELGLAGGINLYGEKQLQIDVWSNDLFTKKLLKSGLVKRLASEEMEGVAEAKVGEYSIVLGPLDGSSNLKSNNLLGTIVGVYREKTLPARGRDLHAAMYFLYGPYHQLVLALQDGVHSFVALGKGSQGSRFVSDGLIRQLPKPPAVYGIGGLREKWTPIVRGFVESLEKRNLSLSYGGPSIGDDNPIRTKEA